MKKLLMVVMLMISSMMVCAQTYLFSHVAYGNWKTGYGNWNSATGSYIQLDKANNRAEMYNAHIERFYYVEIETSNSYTRDDGYEAFALDGYDHNGVLVRVRVVDMGSELHTYLDYIDSRNSQVFLLKK